MKKNYLHREVKWYLTLFDYCQLKMSCKLAFALICMIFGSHLLFAQINHSSTFTGGLGSWTISSGGSGAGTISAGCATSGAIYAVLNQSAISASFDGSLGTSNGGTATLTYRYRITNVSGGGAAPANFGYFQVQVYSSLNSTWTTHQTIGMGGEPHTPSTSCVQKSITFSPLSGSTSMRIVAWWGTGNYNLIFDDITCTQGAAPTAIPGCVTSGFTPADGTSNIGTLPRLSWSAVSNAQRYNVYFGSTPNPPLRGTVFTNSFNVTDNLQPNTTYYWRIVPRNTFGLATGCTTISSFQTGTFPVYCTPTYEIGCNDIDAITKVVLNNLTNNSGCGGYTFYNNVTIPVITQATNPTVSITVGNDGTQYLGVWIDYNQNGIFESAEGVTTTTTTLNNQTRNIVLSVPADAVAGNTRMRIRGGDDSMMTTAQACGATNNGFGESEDYIVYINCTTPPIWYADNDSDGFGNLAISVTACTKPAGYVANSSDCNDSNALVNAQYPFYMDSDSDAFGVGNLINVCAQNASTPPPGYALNNTDCDDSNIAINAAYNFYTDGDNDGFGAGNLVSVCAQNASTPPAGYSLNNTDCNDSNPQLNATFTFYIDADNDGFGTGNLISVCAQNASTSPAGYSLNNTDCDDSNSAVNATYNFYADGDNDGFGAGNLVSACAQNASTPPAGLSINNTDCDDSNSVVNATYSFYADGDNDGFGAGNLVSVCAQNASTPPSGYSLNNTDCDDSNSAVNATYNFYADGDNDGFGTGNLVSVCAQNASTPPSGYSLNNTDCNDSSSALNATYNFYADGDNDGFGAGNPVSVCAQNASTPPSGYSINSTDCDDSNFLINQEFGFYADQDGDGYGAAGSSLIMVCAVSAAAPPIGYSLTNTDCDDSSSNANPGTAEIGYNLIDDDCDGLTDEGFPPKVVQVATATCGTVLPALDTYIYGNLVPGAQGYRWKVTTISGVNPGQIQFLDTPLRAFRLTQLANYAYATTYKIEAAVYFAGFLQPFTASTCTVSTPAVTTKLSSCPTLQSSLTNVIYANSVPFATGYRFRITDPVNPLNTQLLDRPLREFRLTNVTNFEVLYGKTYIVQVAVRNTDGSYLPFGQNCAVSTSQFPTTEIGVAQCDDGFGLPFAVPSMNTPIYANSYPGAIAYVFRLTGLGLPPTGIEITKQLRVFKLSDFAGMGINPGQSYNVNVRLIFELGAPIGSYGKTCTLTVPAASSRMAEIPFNVVAYPNPFSESFNIDVLSSDHDAVTAKVYDMTGRLLDSMKFDNPDSEMAIGENYPSGVYNVIITQRDRTKTLRVVKR